LQHKKGSAKAIKAVARKLAVILYNMLKNKSEFDPLKVQPDTEREQKRKLSYLAKEAAKHGYLLQKAA